MPNYTRGRKCERGDGEDDSVLAQALLMVMRGEAARKGAAPRDPVCVSVTSRSAFARKERSATCRFGKSEQALRLTGDPVALLGVVVSGGLSGWLLVSSDRH